MTKDAQRLRLEVDLRSATANWRAEVSRLLQQREGLDRQLREARQVLARLEREDRAAARG